jgi:hypothetical protein
MNVHILSPTDVKPGAVSPAGRTVVRATLLTNVPAGYAMVAVEYDTPAQGHRDPQYGDDLVRHRIDDVITWPLANNWKEAPRG